MKDFFAVVGIFVSLLALLGALHVGHFRLYYGPDLHGCEKMEAQ